MASQATSGSMQKKNIGTPEETRPFDKGKMEVVKLPTEYGDFNLHLYRSKTDGQHHLALVSGDIAGQFPVS